MNTTEALTEAQTKLDKSTEALKVAVDELKPTLLDKICIGLYYTLMAAMGLYIGYCVADITITLLGRM